MILRPKAYIKSALRNALSDRTTDIISGRTLFRHVHILLSPEHIRHVLSDNAANYEKGPLVRRTLSPLVGDGLFTSDGVTARKHQRIIAPFFTSSRRQHAINIATTLFSSWTATRTADPSSPHIDLSPDLRTLCSELVTEAFFATSVAHMPASTHAALEDVQRTLVNSAVLTLLGMPDTAPRLPSAVLRSARARYQNVVDAIETNPRARQSNCLFARLVRAREDGEMTHHGVNDEIRVMISSAGTLATALGWALYLLATHHDQVDRLRLEADQAVEHTATGLPVARAIAQETLRLYPPIHTIWRAAKKADRLGPHAIAARSHMIIAPWLLHQSERFWDEPKRFDPDRFLGTRALSVNRWIYLPFGAGQRKCLGDRFSLDTMAAILSTIVRHADIALPDADEIRAKALVLLRPHKPIRLQLSRRAA